MQLKRAIENESAKKLDVAGAETGGNFRRQDTNQEKQPETSEVPRPLNMH